MMKTLVGAVLGISIFAVVALAFDSQYRTHFITSATLTINVKDGQYLTIRNFTQDTDAPGQRGAVIAGVVPSTPTPTPSPTPTPTPFQTLSTNAGPAVALGTGAKLTDTATLFENTSPTGTIIFTLQDPSFATVDTETVLVNGNGNYTTPNGYDPNLTGVTGTYTWSALYSGDSNNPAAVDNGQNETEIVTATPTPTPTAAPTPTPINAVVLTATLLNPPANLFHPLPTEFVKPIIIAGPATLTINPVPPATLSITYRKTLQPSQPTPTPTASSISITTSTLTSSATTTLSVGASTGSSTSATTMESMSLDEDDMDSSTPTPSPTPTPTSTPMPTPTPTPLITPTPAP